MYKEIMKDVDNGNIANTRAILANDLRKCKLSKDELDKIILSIKKRPDGKDYIRKNTVADINKNKSDWDEKYVFRLCSLVVSGDMSEQILIHLYEVARYVRGKEKKSKMWILALIIILSGIIIFALARK